MIFLSDQYHVSNNLTDYVNILEINERTNFEVLLISKNEVIMFYVELVVLVFLHIRSAAVILGDDLVWRITILNKHLDLYLMLYIWNKKIYIHYVCLCSQ